MTSPKLLALIIVLALSMVARAATDDATTNDDRWGCEVKAALALGGAAPIPLDRTIRALRSIEPYGCAAVQVDVYRHLDARWGVRSGLRLSLQGVKSHVRVKNYHTQLTMHHDQLTGYYTGLNTNHERFCNLTLPVLATLRLGQRWELSAGPYLQWMLSRTFKGTVYDGYLREGTPTGQKVVFDHQTPATYDFSNSMRRFQWGAEAGCRWQAYRRLSAFAAFDFGFTDVFHHNFRTVNFKMYPLTALLGVGYKL